MNEWQKLFFFYQTECFTFPDYSEELNLHDDDFNEAQTIFIFVFIILYHSLEFLKWDVFIQRSVWIITECVSIGGTVSTAVSSIRISYYVGTTDKDGKFLIKN